MEVHVDVRAQEGEAGAVLSSVPRTAPVASTAVYDAALPQADERIARIIAGAVLPALQALPPVTAAAAR
ncbi:hypothetical protein D3C73_1570660 [compost metagenome]